MSAESDAREATQEIRHANADAEAGIEQRGEELAGIGPEALATMATIQGSLAAAAEWAEKGARDWARCPNCG